MVCCQGKSRHAASIVEIASFTQSGLTSIDHQLCQPHLNADYFLALNGCKLRLGNTVPHGGPVMDRKLAAILAADVVGYSALMERDEAGTHQRLMAGRKELFDPEIARHHGRIFK